MDFDGVIESLKVMRDKNASLEIQIICERLQALDRMKERAEERHNYEQRIKSLERQVEGTLQHVKYEASKQVIARLEQTVSQLSETVRQLGDKIRIAHCDANYLGSRAQAYGDRPGAKRLFELADTLVVEDRKPSAPDDAPRTVKPDWLKSYPKMK